MAGSSKLHTEAAVITPAANPSIHRCQRLWCSPARKNTIPAPRAVIVKVKSVPAAAHCSASFILIRLSRSDSMPQYKRQSGIWCAAPFCLDFSTVSEYSFKIGTSLLPLQEAGNPVTFGPPRLHGCRTREDFVFYKKNLKSRENRNYAGYQNHSDHQSQGKARR